MARIRYLIRWLSVQAMLYKRNPSAWSNNLEQYVFSLTPAQTKEAVMRDGDNLAGDNTIFAQTMCVLCGNEYEQPTEDTVFSDRFDALLYLNFK